MDPNAENPPPSVQVTEVDVDSTTEVSASFVDQTGETISASPG